MKRFLLALFIVYLAVMFVALTPVSAQDEQPTPSAESTQAVIIAPVDTLPVVEVTEVAPSEPPVIVVNNPAPPPERWYESELFWVFLISLGAILLSAANKDKTIHKLAVEAAVKVPSILYAGGKEVINKTLDAAEDKAALTADPDDDKYVARLREEFAKYLAEVDAKRAGDIQAAVDRAVAKSMDGVLPTAERFQVGR